jgi:ABC-type metal ion transport system substrate-binding protein
MDTDYGQSTGGLEMANILAEMFQHFVYLSQALSIMENSDP